MSTPSTTLAAAGTTEAALAPLERLRRAAPWWLLPVTVVVVLGGFTAYSCWVATIGAGYPLRGGAKAAPYLSPFYSPEFLSGRVPVFPALLCILVPLAFRGTCYYYRKAYHRSFFLDPPACAVGELRHRPYRGESALPLALNNLHRFAMYLAVIYMIPLSYDAVQAFSFDGHGYVGLGTAIMLVNVVLLMGYTFSCHSLRHLVGGGVDCFSCARFGRPRQRAYRLVSRLNLYHPTWAWVSLASVLAVDVYIRLLGAGAISDPHLTL